MLTRRYKKYKHTRAQPPNNVKKLRHFHRILPWHVSEACQQCWPLPSWESVDKCQSGNSTWHVNGPSRKWYRLIQTSWSPYDIYTTSTKRLGVVITQDNWPIAFVVDSLRRAINKHHYRIRTLSQMSSTECCGDTNIRLYQPYLIEKVGQTPNRVLHIGEYSNRDMSPRSSIRADT